MKNFKNFREQQNFHNINYDDYQLQLKSFYENVKFYLYFLNFKNIVFAIKNKYPTKHEIMELAKMFDAKFSKIDNWFKHKRRSEVSKGIMKYEV